MCKKPNVLENNFECDLFNFLPKQKYNYEKFKHFFKLLNLMGTYVNNMIEMGSILLKLYKLCLVHICKINHTLSERYIEESMLQNLNRTVNFY